jgi:hypothetical protein
MLGYHLSPQRLRNGAALQAHGPLLSSASKRRNLRRMQWI